MPIKPSTYRSIITGTEFSLVVKQKGVLCFETIILWLTVEKRYREVKIITWGKSHTYLTHKLIRARLRLAGERHVERVNSGRGETNLVYSFTLPQGLLEGGLTGFDGLELGEGNGVREIDTNPKQEEALVHNTKDGYCTCMRCYDDYYDFEQARKELLKKLTHYHE